MSYPHRPKLLRALALLTIVIGLAATFPGAPAAAQQISETQTLDNSQVEFTRGDFQRTSISADQSPVSTSPADLKGTVQLAPIGTLKAWEKVAIELPTARTPQGDDGTRGDPAVVSIGNRIFVIAGTDADGSVDTALYATVDQTLGNIVAHGISDTRRVDDFWLNASLPQATLVPTAIPACNVGSVRTRAAATALTTGTNSGFIYVVGGLAAPNMCDGDPLTISAVQIGKVESNGTLTWTTHNTPLPSASIEGIDYGPRGVEMASATAVRTSSGKAYLYVIGGLSTFRPLAGATSHIEKSVWRAEINTATGALGAWVRDDDVPVNDPTPNDSYVGIYDHVAAHVTTVVTTDGGSSVKDGIMVAGGFSKDPGAELNPFVYLASINASNGDLTWSAKPSVDNRDVALVQGGQSGMSGVAYNNKLYMIGGLPSLTPGTQPVRWVQTAVFNDDLKIQNLPGSVEYFIGKDSTVLPEARANAGATLMDALPPAGNPDQSIGTAWVFAVGGTNAASARSRFIYRGRIGGDEAEGNIRTTDGWFYSKVFDITFQLPGQDKKNAKVLSIRWAAEVDRSVNTQADMIVEFRRVLRSDPNCTDESVFNPDDPANAWKRLPKTGSFYSESSTAVKPFNTVTLADAFGTESFNATCFQYRVRFLQNGVNGSGVPVVGANLGGSPKLFSMNIEKVLTSSPDLRIPNGGFAANVTSAGRMTSFTTTIQNLNLEGLQNTEDVGIAGDGSFYVHLCVAYAAPGAAAPTLTLPTLPLPNGQKPACFRAFYEVYNWQLRAGRSLALTKSGTQSWRREQGNQEVAIDDIRTLFNTPGTYKVALIIDAWNYIPEGTAGEQNNRGEEAYSQSQPQVLTFTIQGAPLNVVNLPMVRR